MLTRVERIEAGFIGRPAYDSGWLTIAPSETIYLEHGLLTDEVFVYLTGIDDDFETIHQQSYGGRCIRDPPEYLGAWWFSLNYTHILVGRATDDQSIHVDQQWDNIRIQIWKIPEP